MQGDIALVRHHAVMALHTVRIVVEEESAILKDSKPTASASLRKRRVGRDGCRLALNVDDLQVVDRRFQVIELLGVDLLIRTEGSRNIAFLAAS